MLFNPSLAEMGEFARCVWLATHNAPACECQAVAWMLKNRLVADLGGALGSAGGGAERPEIHFYPIFQDFLGEEAEVFDCVRDAPISFDDMRFARALSTVCLVWNGEIADPTQGAVRCHRHDRLPEWAHAQVPSALIGSRFFYPPG